VKKLWNYFRNIILFRLKYPWVCHGRDIHCQINTTFWSPRRHVIIGNRVGIGSRCIFLCDIEIGDDVLIGSNCAFLNVDDHRYDIVGKTIWNSGRGDKYKIVIEDDIWIGHGAIILTPTRIGRGAVVAAGSLVTRNVPPYAIVGGVPARVLRMRFSPEQIKEHERLIREG
jgi:acetyltransferase-like isoleucine patch superfamily enzyme